MLDKYCNYVFIIYVVSMDEATILGREGRRISEFLDLMLIDGLINNSELHTINQELENLFRQVGYVDAQGRPDEVASDEYCGVIRHANFLKRKKLIELHPELEGELDRHLAYRPYHPLPPVPPELRSPGAAFKLYMKFIKYIDDKRDDRTLTRDQAYNVYAPMHIVLEDSGICISKIDPIRTPAEVLHQAYVQGKAVLLRLRPDLEVEVNRIGITRSR